MSLIGILAAENCIILSKFLGKDALTLETKSKDNLIGRPQVVTQADQRFVFQKITRRTLKNETRTSDKSGS